ncbi:hypothetical protein [Haloterrigena alkaliphila]|uniref:Uncharacterized protein n=1 Tax=Haloterrigena alkaliphila TaxID=2816475 RepID=A0A8A2VQ33_9EURY|nr:hypothetical protein [Haloterrigena alkaliphila]QSX00219.1 hypothetical protein J0X25_04435 [Haloterrigena alkaliphila]
MSAKTLELIGVPRLGKFVAAVIVGLGIGTLVAPEPVTVPTVGAVPGLLAGSAAIAVGTGLYLWIKRTTAGCGCGGGC